MIGLFLDGNSSVVTPLLLLVEVIPCWTVAEKNGSLFCVMLVFGHLADHVVEDASVVEIRQFHISVESHPHLEYFSCVQL